MGQIVARQWLAGTDQIIAVDQGAQHQMMGVAGKDQGDAQKIEKAGDQLALLLADRIEDEHVGQAGGIAQRIAGLVERRQHGGAGGRPQRRRRVPVEIDALRHGPETYHKPCFLPWLVC